MAEGTEAPNSTEPPGVPPAPTPPPAPSAPAPAGGDPPAAPSPVAGGEPPAEPGAPVSAADLLAEKKPLEERVPEKLRVKKEDGTLDLEATFAKLADARAALEKKMGSGDLPPAAATDYKLNLPEQFKQLESTLDPETTMAFRERALAVGITQAQFDFVMTEWASASQALVGGARALDINTSREVLQQAWGDDMQANLEDVDKGLLAYGGADAAAILRDYAADPRIMMMMARVGANYIGEDTSPKTPGVSAGDTEADIRALIRSEAYTDSRHADHERVSARVRGFFQRQPGAMLPGDAIPVS